MIPKIIHYCWFGGEPKPKSVLRCIRSWQKYCPDFEIREWTEKDFDVTQHEFTRQAYEAKAWGFVTDYIRLWAIYHYGGIYMDTDVQVLKDLTPLLEHGAYVGFERDEYVNLGHGFGAEKGHPFVKAHLEMYDTIRFVNDDGTLDKTPIPHHTTRCLRAFGMQDDTGVVQQLGDIAVYPRDYFSPKSFATGILTLTPNTYSIHQFDASWFDDTRQEEKLARWKRAQRKARKAWLKKCLCCVLGPRGFDTLKRWVHRR